MTESNPTAERLIALLSGRPVTTERFASEDWQRIIELAQQQRVAPLLNARLREREISLGPEGAKQLRELLLANIKHNTRLLHQLQKILTAFQAANIPVIPLKGACLAEAVYGDVALRQIGDLDLLVKLTDLEKALDVLTTLEYVAAEPFDIESERQLSQHMPRLYKSGRVELDLHWTIVNPWLNIPFDESELGQVWSRAVPVTIAGVNVLMLSPVDLLLYLCLHTSVQHRFDGVGLRSFWDMALVIRRYGAKMDWEQFAERMQRWGIANGVQLVLHLLEEWTDTDIPTSVMPPLMPGTPAAVTLDRVRQRVLPTRAGGTARLGDVLVALRDLLFPSRRVMADEYHVPADSWRILCYYPVRFKELWMRHPQAMWQVLKRDKELLEMQQNLYLREYLD